MVWNVAEAKKFSNKIWKDPKWLKELDCFIFSIFFLEFLSKQSFVEKQISSILTRKKRKQKRLTNKNCSNQVFAILNYDFKLCPYYTVQMCLKSMALIWVGSVGKSWTILDSDWSKVIITYDSVRFFLWSRLNLNDDYSGLDG